MGRFLKPRHKFYRREGIDLLLKDRFSFCDLHKSDVNNDDKKNKDFLPTYFSFQLKEKQRLKLIYGVLECQFKSYYYKSKKLEGKLSENLMKLLESRLDNIVYRMGLGVTRAESRQYINHNFFLVNNRPLNIPSYLVKLGDIVSLKKIFVHRRRIFDSFKNFFNKKKYPSWIFINFKNFSCYIKRYPDLIDLDITVDDNLVFDFYSR